MVLNERKLQSEFQVKKNSILKLIPFIDYAVSPNRQLLLLYP